MTKRKVLDFDPARPEKPEEWRAQVFWEDDKGNVRVIERGYFSSREQAGEVAKYLRDQAEDEGLKVIQTSIASELI